MAPAARPGGLTPDDHRAYECLLSGVYAACNMHDADALAELATPEMAERLADRFACDVYDVVTGLHLHRMRPVDVWSEDGFDHAAVHMRYSMTVVVHDGYGRVVHGTRAGRVEVEEVWTCVRHGRWLLRAIRRGNGLRPPGSPVLPEP